MIFGLQKNLVLPLPEPPITRIDVYKRQVIRRSGVGVEMRLPIAAVQVGIGNRISAMDHHGIADVDLSLIHIFRPRLRSFLT